MGNKICRNSVGLQNEVDLLSVCSMKIRNKASASRTFLLHAPNVHEGGGRALLIELIKALTEDQKQSRSLAILDERLYLERSLKERLSIISVAPTIMERLRAEWILARRARESDLLLCFGNLPPLLPVRAQVVVFLQNCYHVKKKLPHNLPIGLKIKLSLERYWLRKRLRRCHSVVVQSETMHRQVYDALGVKSLIAPFAPSIFPRWPTNVVKKRDYIYVASAAPHKNHRKLIEAWIYLAGQGAFPSLALTLNSVRCKGLCKWIQKRTAEHGLQIELLGELGEVRLEDAYRESKSLIFPSLFESFGLPLLEAKAHGLSVLTAERDYVRDTITPDETFDPKSAVSIARAVIRHMGLSPERTTVLSGKDFLDRIQRTD